MKSDAFLNIEKKDNFCFHWSILAQLYPYEYSHPTRVKIRGNFKKLYNKSFDFTNRFKCNDVPKNEKKNLSTNILQLNVCQEQDENKWNQKSIPIAISKNEPVKFVDLLISKNHYALIKTFHVFLGNEILIVDGV